MGEREKDLLKEHGGIMIPFPSLDIPTHRDDSLPRLSKIPAGSSERLLYSSDLLIHTQQHSQTQPHEEEGMRKTCSSDMRPNARQGHLPCSSLALEIPTCSPLHGQGFAWQPKQKNVRCMHEH